MSQNKMILTVAGDREIVITRVFDAPRERVYAAFTKPTLLRRWLLGPPGWEMTRCDVDLRVGGAYRYEWAHPEQGKMAVHGHFVEVVPPERVVATEVFEPAWYEGEGYQTTAFSEADGKTTLTQTLRYGTTEARDAILNSGMGDGMAYTFDTLAELLAETA